jgi:hypothetical protein
MTGRMLSIRNGPADSCAGTDVGRSSRLISVFVSMTTRSLAFIGKDFGQLFLGQSGRPPARQCGRTRAGRAARQRPGFDGRSFRLTLRSIEHGRESLLASVAETYRIECGPEFI